MCQHCVETLLDILLPVKLFDGFVRVLEEEGWDSTFEEDAIAWLKANRSFYVVPTDCMGEFVIKDCPVDIVLNGFEIIQDI